MNGSIDAWRGSGVPGRAANAEHKQDGPGAMLRLLPSDGAGLGWGGRGGGTERGSGEFGA